MLSPPHPMRKGRCVLRKMRACDSMSPSICRSCGYAPSRSAWPMDARVPRCWHALHSIRWDFAVPSAAHLSHLMHACRSTSPSMCLAFSHASFARHIPSLFFCKLLPFLCFLFVSPAIPLAFAARDWRQATRPLPDPALRCDVKRPHGPSVPTVFRRS